MSGNNLKVIVLRLSFLNYLLQYYILSMANRDIVICVSLILHIQVYSSLSNINLYTKDINERLSIINKAVADYKPLKVNNCSCFDHIIKRDLLVFKEGITKDMIKEAKSKGSRYVLRNHTLYRENDCLFPARCSGVQHFLKLLAPELPDFELILNTRDWPQISKYHNKLLPVFSFSKTLEYNDILYPAWSFWEGGPAIKLYPTGLGRWDQHRKILIDKSKEWPWSLKTPVAFFRGSRTSNERDPLIILSRERPDLVDAAYTKNQAWKSEMDTLGANPVNEVSLEDHCKYKYLFNFRGIAASFRFKHLFLCGSLVFHVGNEWEEFFYPKLVPWVHFVPVDKNAKEQNLRDLIEFFIKHDDIAQEIAVRGKTFILKYLRMSDLKCYWKTLLVEYSNLLKYQPNIDDKLINIS